MEFLPGRPRDCRHDKEIKTIGLITAYHSLDDIALYIAVFNKRIRAGRGNEFDNKLRFYLILFNLYEVLADGTGKKYQYRGGNMSEINMTGELRTDYECETRGMPAMHWGEAVFNVGGEEIIMEISVEEKVIVALSAGDEAVWKGTLEGLKMLLKGEIKGR